MIKHVFTMLILLVFMLNGYAQGVEKISIAATSEAIGFPFTNYLPYHPGIELKATLRNKERPQSIRQINVNAGYFFHRKVENAFYLGGEYQYTQKLFNSRIGLDIPAGLGYLHTFYPSELYEQTDSGDFERITSLGRPHLYVNLGIGLTYLNDSKIQPFIRQELFLETPFATSIPVIPHSLLKVGIQINLNNESE